jgi:NAD-dependent dihydropyrimidine dehydrogenase PreA subunit
MIFYFSGTGNTRWAVQELAEKTGEQLVYIPDVIQGDCTFTLGEGERLGLAFPIHGWRVPQFVIRFLEKLHINSDGHYTYVLCTAGDSIGKALDRMQKHMHIDAAFSLIMPESYVGLPFMDVDPQEKEQQKKRQAASQLIQVIDDIKTMRTSDGKPYGWDQLVRGPIPGFFSGPVGAFFVKYLVTDKPFHVEVDRCIQCGICAEVCPVGDIDGGKGKYPKWNHQDNCLTCFTCYHHCPKHAIEYGHRTQEKGQYFFKDKKSTPSHKE